MADRSCRFCRHYNGQAAECRRYPPTPVPSTYLVQLPSPNTSLIPGINPIATANLQISTSQWSKVPPDAWCGEFDGSANNK